MLTLLICTVQLVISRYELNQQMKDGKTVEEYTPTGKFMHARRLSWDG
jgi:hypothetical protein